jgi:alkylation response protein AidB-like acyl-CoA dehydrogenase
MHLELCEEQVLLRDTFAQLFAVESSPERVRAAEPLGFDAALWKQLGNTGALCMRAPEAAGGGGASLLDAAIVAHEAGRQLASGPLVEAIVAARLLAVCDDAEAAQCLARLRDGSGVVSLALRDLRRAPAQLIPGGAVAQAVVGLAGEDIVLLGPRDLAQPTVRPAPANLASSPLAEWRVAECAPRVIATGGDARRRFLAGLEEWKLLTAAALVGLAREALEIAGRYACERIQFERPIGSFQGVAHPLADSVADVDGAQLLLWKAIWSIARGRAEAAALVSMSFGWSSLAATRAVARALHTHGGYGLSLEYDIQLYHRRGKAWGLALGDPQEELLVAADRLWGGPGRDAPLPDAGDIPLDFALGDEAAAFAAAARRFFEENLTDALRAHAHFAWEGHHPAFQRQLAQAGLLFPAWPKQYGGQDRSPYEMAALAQVFAEFGWTRFAITTTGMVGQTLMRFATPELAREVLPRIAAGEAICSLGYTEPGSGSDVAAARTRAMRDGDAWIIDGQKMFTSGANLAQYVFLLTRTNPTARKHKGLTMFLVPLDTPGIEIQPVHTLSDERTNITYYTEVRIPDRYRVGEVDGGWAVIAYALELEHGAGVASSQRRMLAGAVAWARATRRGSGSALDVPHVRMRLARAAVHAEVADAISARSLYVAAEGIPDPAIGPITKFFSTDRFIEDAADLMDLCAPDSLLRGLEGGAAEGASAVEFAYRLSTATSIYGGTSEIMKSIVAQASLGLPRSRS